MSSLKKAVSSVRTYAYIVDVASMASRRWRRVDSVDGDDSPPAARGGDAVSTEAVSLKHLKTSRSMTSLSLWGSAE